APGPGEKPGPEPVELVRPLHARHVGGAFDRRAAGAGDLPLQPIGKQMDVGDVEPADEHERGYGDLAEAVADIENERFFLRVRAPFDIQLQRTALHLATLAPVCGAA